MATFKVKRIQHVSLTRPFGSGEQARAFYGEILGLTEIPPPQSLSRLDLIWYRLGSDELHLVGEERPDNTNSGRHLCIEINDLAALRERFASAGVAMDETIPIPGRPRFFATDPFDNRIEFTEIQSDTYQ